MLRFTEYYSAQCENCCDLVSHFWQKFRESNFLLKKLLKSWFNEISFGATKFSTLCSDNITVSQCGKTKNLVSPRKCLFRQINSLVISILKTHVIHDIFAKNVRLNRSNLLTHWELVNTSKWKCDRLRIYFVSRFFGKFPWKANELYCKFN